MYEGGIRTPALVTWSGRLMPRDEHSPVHVADWFPTLAGLAGYKPMADLKWDGTDRWPVLTGTAKAEPRVLYWLGPGGNSLAIRRGELVLIQHKGKPNELYDLAADPAQKIDLAAKRPEVVQELTGLLTKGRERDGDAKVKSRACGEVPMRLPLGLISATTRSLLLATEKPNMVFVLCDDLRWGTRT